jgi:hypothetical protein
VQSPHFCTIGRDPEQRRAVVLQRRQAGAVIRQKHSLRVTVNQDPIAPLHRARDAQAGEQAYDDECRCDFDERGAAHEDNVNAVCKTCVIPIARIHDATTRPGHFQRTSSVPVR